MKNRTYGLKILIIFASSSDRRIHEYPTESSIRSDTNIAGLHFFLS
jgi:hypothetical protein